jgi:hypothetical protein
MKKIFLLLISLSLCKIGFSQDRIFIKNNKQITVQIVEQTDKIVKYKMLDYGDSPVLSIKNRLISKIEYQNGIIDEMGNQNPRKNKPLGINTGLQLGEDGNFTATLDYFITPQIDLEINYGTDFYRDFPYFSTGTRIHINSDLSTRKVIPFLGLLWGSIYQNSFLQIPIGLNFTTKLGFNASASLNSLINLKTNFDGYYVRPQTVIGEIRIGWRFKCL